MELKFEQEEEISLVLSQQKEIFEKILTEKQTGQKYNLRTIENEIISQLQNQVKNLENSVENKFNLILKTIETQSQNQSQTQSQNQLSNQISNQTSSQASTQFSNQSFKQVKTYTQVTADKSQAKENSFQIK